jgi:hypothetical protein
VLAGVELGGAGVALVCGAPLSAAGVFCANAGTPKLAANNIAAIDPGVAVPFVTISLCRPKTKFGGRARTPVTPALVSLYCKRLAKQISPVNK